MRRSVGHFLQGEIFKQFLKKQLPPYALVHLEKAFEGDADAAFRLIAAAPNRFRAHILVAAYYLGTPNPAYRTIVREVWDGDHDQVVLLTRNNRPWIKRMLAAGEFDVSCLSNKFHIWRGCRNSRFIEAAKGLSWTTDRNVACWFACRYSGKKPLVLRATVHRDDVVFFSDSRGENEVVARAITNAQIDGTEADWRAGQLTFQTKMQEERRRYWPRFQSGA